jgi:hypothetical protein
MEEWCQETFGKLLEAKARNDKELRRTGNMGETIIGGCLIEKRQRELSHMGESLYVYREAGRRIAAAGD